MPTLISRVKTKDSVELYVKDWGVGRPVVFVHGWPFNADSWDYHAHALVEAGYRTISYDKRGFGRSSQPASGYDFDTLAADLAAVIDASDVREATLVGYSMGGGEIVRYLSRYGAGRIAKVALIASIVAGLPKSPGNPRGVDASEFDAIKAGILQNRPSFMAGVVTDVIYDLAAPASSPVTPEVLDWSHLMSMQASLRALLGCVDAFGRTDFRPELAAVTVPTLILHGTADKPVPIEISARAAAAGIPQATLVEYRGASHGILVTEQERVARDLLAFLAT
jgi:non-heme chloroperoxidase